MRSLIPLAFLFLLAGCVAHIPLSKQLPVPGYQAQDGLIVAVIDNRKRVKEGKPKTFIGVVHGAFGIPSDCKVDPWISVEEGDDKRDLAQFLQQRIVAGLKQQGWQVGGVEVTAVPDATEAGRLLANNRARKLLVLELNEWYFSINLNWVTAFNFDTDTNVVVFAKDNQQAVLRKNFSGRDVIDAQSNESYQNHILMAYREQLNEILNDPDVKKALQDPLSAPPAL